jgi:hypothetical protein
MANTNCIDVKGRVGVNTRKETRHVQEVHADFVEFLQAVRIVVGHRLRSQRYKLAKCGIFICHIDFSRFL